MIKKKKVLFLVLALVMSQAYGQYEMRKYSINSGGGKTTGGDYVINSSIGQIDASSVKTGGNYTLNAGFWHPKDTTPQTDLIFTNGFE